ncbi:MAG TPA: ATP-binding protein, partial [Jiangellaceae bacterium]|nr:ATP-binding protein [Jiangellaceae bacterium]
AAVGEALANTDTHAGDDARSWVVLEDRGDLIEVVVRDNGRGIDPGRLDRAEAEGRYGVSGSIRGRLAALGGHAVLHSSPGEGTEWELSVPKEAM